MKAKNTKGVTIKTACLAIQDANKKIERAQADRDVLIEAAIKDFEFKNYEEFRKYFFTH